MPSSRVCLESEAGHQLNSNGFTGVKWTCLCHHVPCSMHVPALQVAHRVQASQKLRIQFRDAKAKWCAFRRTSVAVLCVCSSMWSCTDDVQYVKQRQVRMNRSEVKYVTFLLLSVGASKLSVCTELLTVEAVLNLFKVYLDLSCFQVAVYQIKLCASIVVNCDHVPLVSSKLFLCVYKCSASLLFLFA